MGDTVQRLLEEMVPELEDLTKRQIFSEEEVKSITRKREDFEYLLLRRNPETGDFLHYIDYELALDRLRKKRKARKGLKRNTICDFAIIRRIHYLYDRLLRKFPGDVKLWLRYIEWSVGLGSDSRLGKIFTRVLQLHPQEPVLWAKAADWSFRSNDDVDTARVILQRGIRLNPKSPELYLFFFQLEIQYIERFRERKIQLGLISKETNPEMKELSDFLSFDKSGEDSEPTLNTQKVIPQESNLDEKDRAILAGLLPRFIFTKVIQIPTFARLYPLRLQFLNLIPHPPLQETALNTVQDLDLTGTETEKEEDKEDKEDGDKKIHPRERRSSSKSSPSDWPFKELKEMIYESLIRDFPKNEESWDQRARGALELSLLEATNKKETTSDIPEDDAKPLEVDATQVFEVALKKVPTARMWELYVAFLYERWRAYKTLESKLYHETPSNALSVVISWLQSQLSDVLSRAAKKKKHMTQETFEIWVQFLLQDGMLEKALQISELALSDRYFPSSLSLWLSYLKLVTIQYQQQQQQKQQQQEQDAEEESDEEKEKKEGSLSMDKDVLWRKLSSTYKKSIKTIEEKVDQKEFISEDRVRGWFQIWENFIALHIDRAESSRDRRDWQAASLCFQLGLESLGSTISRADTELAISITEELKTRYLDWAMGALIETSEDPKSQLVEINPSKDAPVALLEREDIGQVIDWVLRSVKVGRTAPSSCSLYLKAIELQSVLLEKDDHRSNQGGNLQKLKILLEAAVDLYGSQSAEIWLKYVSLMMQLGDISLASRVHWRALKSLSPNKQASYLSVYNEQHFPVVSSPSHSKKTKRKPKLK